MASCPTSRSPFLANPTTEAVRRLPSLLIITVGWPPSITATTEFVVPRSMPIALAMTASEPVKRSVAVLRGARVKRASPLTLSLADLVGRVCSIALTGERLALEREGSFARRRRRPSAATVADGKPSEGTWRAHQVPIAEMQGVMTPSGAHVRPGCVSGASAAGDLQACTNSSRSALSRSLCVSAMPWGAPA